MSFQLYKTRLKCLLRNKETMFWSYMFPILLSTCFFFAFSNLTTADSFNTISIAYVSQATDTAESDYLKEAINITKISEGTPMFSVTYCDKDKASKLLEDNTIDGYIEGGNNPKLFIKENGMNETIIKSFLDSYLQRAASVENILISNPQAVNEGLLTDILQYDNFVSEKKDEKKPDAILIYFYSLLAFTCIFSANSGLEEVINIQADQSNRGARINVSPIRKMKLFLYNMIAAFTVHCGSLILLFLYMYYMLKVNFGDNLLFTLITCVIGSLTGLSVGAAVGIWVKAKSEVKEAALTVVVLGGGFLSGMMVIDMKYIIADKFPLLSYINPVNLVTDALYSLYYYKTYERFLLNIAILCIITLLLGLVSYIGMRRKNYASI